MTRTLVCSAERLTAAWIDAVRTTVRMDTFHPEPQRPAEVRSELGDVRR